jgi:dTDP-glucose 4,6-dehydratase
MLSKFKEVNMNTKVVYITGCLGFIGSYLTRTCLSYGWHVLGIDSETYAANLDYLNEFNSYKNFKYLKKNINDFNMLYDCDYIINTAAETHVDNSISNGSEFIKSNIDGVHNLLRLIQTKHRYRMPALVHFSTDEVYGDKDIGRFSETDLMKPSNPYSATKASADMLITAWHRTYGIPYLIVRPSNNYGIGQYVEKFIPKTIKYLTLGKPVPLHDKGVPMRTWLHAQDTADAVLHLINSNKINDIYNISGNYEDSNLAVFQKILTCFDIDPTTYEQYVDFNVFRPGHDVRYSIDDSKLRNLGWTNKKIFDFEIENIVAHHRARFVW